MIGGLIIWNQWWAWIGFGLILGALEMILPAYIFLGFAGGAVATGGLIGIGLFDQPLPWTLVLFALLSLLCVALLRLTLGAPTQRAKVWKTDIND